MYDIYFLVFRVRLPTSLIFSRREINVGWKSLARYPSDSLGSKVANVEVVQISLCICTMDYGHPMRHKSKKSENFAKEMTPFNFLRTRKGAFCIVKHIDEIHETFTQQPVNLCSLHCYHKMNQMT